MMFNKDKGFWMTMVCLSVLVVVAMFGCSAKIADVELAVGDLSGASYDVVFNRRSGITFGPHPHHKAPMVTFATVGDGELASVQLVDGGVYDVEVVDENGDLFVVDMYRWNFDGAQLSDSGRYNIYICKEAGGGVRLSTSKCNDE